MQPRHSRAITADVHRVVGAQVDVLQGCCYRAKVVAMNPLSPKKLLLSKWTALQPVRKDKHFLIAKVIAPEVEGTAIEWVELEAIFSKTSQKIRWRDLQNADVWAQGWV